MQILRRNLLKAGLIIASAMAFPRLVLAWPEQAFKVKSRDEALKEIYGTTDHSQSEDVKLKAPDIAENGAVVPVTVSSGMADVESIAIIVDDNPSPLTAVFELGAGAIADVSTRIKMGKTSTVLAVVKANGKLYSSAKEVKVTIGGCGG
jgi:sulfur-oxidizing protein SoxY